MPPLILPVMIIFPAVDGIAPPAIRARLLLKRLARTHHARCEWLPEKPTAQIPAPPDEDKTPPHPDALPGAERAAHEELREALERIKRE